MRAIRSIRICSFVLLFAVLFAGVLHAQAPVERYLLTDFNTGLVHMVNVADNTEAAAITAGASPEFVAVSPNGRLAFTASVNSNYISVIDFTLNPGTEIARIEGVHARPLTLSADGSRLYGLTFSDELVVIDASNFNVLQRIPLNIEANPNNVDPRGIVVVGQKAYVQVRSTDMPLPVFVVDLAAATPSASPIGGTTTGSTGGGDTIAATPDGKYVVALRQGPAPKVFIIDTSTDTVVATPPPGGAGHAIAIPQGVGSPDGVIGYLITTQQPGSITMLSSIDLRPTVSGSANPGFGSIHPLKQLPSFLNGIGFIRAHSTADGNHLYVSTPGILNPNVVEVDTSTLVITPLFIPGNMSGMAMAFTQTSAPPAAPQVTDVNSNETFKGLVVNNAPATITVTGSGFSSDVHVRVGNLDTAAPVSGTSSSLQVNVAPSVPAQVANIIATNFDSSSSVSNQMESGILRGQLVIASPSSYQPANQVVTSNFDSTVSVLNGVTTTSVPGSNLATAVAISPDASRAYLTPFSGLSANSVEVFNLATNQFDPSIPLTNTSGNALGQGVSIVSQPAPGLPGNGDALGFVISSHATPGGINEQLNVIDVQSSDINGNPNPAFNTVLGTILSSFTDCGQPCGGPQAVSATPDGKYVYETTTDGLNGKPQLVIFDIAAGNAFAGSPLGTYTVPYVTPDGKSLLLTDSNGAIDVFDITQPLQPTQGPSISGVPSSLFFDWYQVVGANLFAYADAQNTVQAFNFDRNSAQFGQLEACIVLPGPLNLFAQMAVAPDGSMIYAALHDQDAVAAIDTAKLLAQGPGCLTGSSALLTTIRTGLAPTFIAVRPGTFTPASSSPDTTVTVQPLPAVTVSLANSSGGTTNVVVTNTTDVAQPSGFQLGSIPVYYNVFTTAGFSQAVVCIQYDPASAPSPESSLRMAHYDHTYGWIDVTLAGYPDTTNHVICGEVSNFSPFTVGIPSAGFLFHTLLADIAALRSPNGIVQSLGAKAQAAATSAGNNDNGTAANQLNALLNEIRAQSGKTLSPNDANRIISVVGVLLNQL